jgi:hypothetical protein
MRDALLAAATLCLFAGLALAVAFPVLAVLGVLG